MKRVEQIQKLQVITRQIIEGSEEAFGDIHEEIFNHNVRPGQWSIAQCLNHLNHYANFYHGQFKSVQNRKEKALFKKQTEEIKYSWLTKNLMKYIQLDENDSPIRKTKAPRKTFQVNSDFTKEEYDRFLHNQKEMLSLLHTAEEKSLYCHRKINTMFPLLRMKVLDLLLMNVHHNYRHYVQAKNTLTQIKITSN